MTLHFPDVSHHQGSLSLNGAPAVFAKATQGTSFVDPHYAGFKAQAAVFGIPVAAYHWLDTTDAAAQARHCYSIVGPGTPLMIDDEQGTISVPHTLAFATAYRALGGRVVLEYAPQWVWSRSGRPDLRPLAAAGLALVASNYPSAGYTETGPGWAAYGGVTPTIWQYTDSAAFGGQRVDMNAYRGDINQLRQLLGGTPSTVEDDDMATVQQADWEALIWRVEALISNRPVVIGGPRPGEVNQLAVAVAAAQGDPITPAQLAEMVAAAKAGAEAGATEALDGVRVTTTSTIDTTP